MKVEVAVLGSPSLSVLMVSVDVKHHEETSRKSSQPCRSVTPERSRRNLGQVV